jgi:glycosyltransferase involved in cell wall biosynthesis
MKNKVLMEKIYALMITGLPNRMERAKKSVASFQRQIYPNKELVIVNDGDYSLLDEMGIDDENIVEVYVEEKCPLGELRNISLEEIPNGAMFVQWDDDDWHHEELMQKQHEYMMAHNLDASFLNYQIRFYVSKNTALTAHRDDGIDGTIMARKFADIKYPDKDKVGEDSVFRNLYFSKNKKVAFIDAHPAYYLRFIHGNNVWDEKHFKLDQIIDNLWEVDQQGSIYLENILKNFYNEDWNSTANRIHRKFG